MYPPQLRDDFQDTPWWAPTVTEILTDLASRHPGPIIVPMTLADFERHGVILGGPRTSGVDVRHVTLLAKATTVHRRLRGRFETRDSGAAAQFARVDERLRRPEFATHIDTGGLSLTDAVEHVAQTIGVEVSYSARERLLLPLRRMRVQLRHVRL